jgi:hypothetical protein
VASLLDIGPLTASVTVRGKEISVSGIGADTLVQLLNNYPEIKQYMGGFSGAVNEDFMTKLGPEIVDAIIMAGAGFKLDNKDARDKVSSLYLGEKMEMLEPIMMMTFPKGFPSFVEALSRIAGEAGEGADVSGKVPGTK